MSAINPTPSTSSITPSTTSAAAIPPPAQSQPPQTDNSHAFTAIPATVYQSAYNSATPSPLSGSAPRSRAGSGDIKAMGSAPRSGAVSEDDNATGAVVSSRLIDYVDGTISPPPANNGDDRYMPATFRRHRDSIRAAAPSDDDGDAESPPAVRRPPQLSVDSRRRISSTAAASSALNDDDAASPPALRYDMLGRSTSGDGEIGGGISPQRKITASQRNKQPSVDHYGPASRKASAAAIATSLLQQNDGEASLTADERNRPPENDSPLLNGATLDDEDADFDPDVDPPLSSLSRYGRRPPPRPLSPSDDMSRQYRVSVHRAGNDDNEATAASSASAIHFSGQSGQHTLDDDFDAAKRSYRARHSRRSGGHTHDGDGATAGSTHHSAMHFTGLSGQHSDDDIDTIGSTHYPQRHSEGRSEKRAHRGDTTRASAFPPPPAGLRFDDDGMDRAQKRMKQIHDHVNYATIGIVVGLACTIITILAMIGVFPKEYAGAIVGGTNLVGTAIGFLILRKLQKIDLHLMSTRNKIEYAAAVITCAALSVLAITNVLTPQLVGLGILASGLLYGGIRAIAANLETASQVVKEHKKEYLIDVILELIPVALTIINVLGATGVLGGDHASLILGVTNLTGGLFYIVAKHLLAPPDADPGFHKGLAYFSIYSLAMGILGMTGVSPVTVGLTGIALKVLLEDAFNLHFHYGWKKSLVDREDAPIAPSTP